VIRTRVFSAGGRAFFRGIRLGASPRPRILADAGVAGLSLGANLASISGAGAGRVWSTGGRLGIGDAGLDGIGTGALGAGADSNFLVDEAGAAWGIETGVFALASGGLGAIAGRGASGGGTSETSGLRSRRNSSSLSSTRLTGRGRVAGGIGRLASVATGLGSFLPRRAVPQISHSSSSGSLSAPQVGHRTRSRMSSSTPGGSGSASNSAAHRGHFVSPAATKPPQFVQMNRRPTSPFSKMPFGSRSRSCFVWRKPASNSFRAFSRSSPKARLSRTTASSMTKAPQFAHSVSSGGMGSAQTGHRTRACFPGIDVGFDPSRGP